MGQDDLTLTVEDNWVAAEDMGYTGVAMILFVQVLKCILSLQLSCYRHSEFP